MRTVVGVLRGGPSNEYEISLKTGASVLDALDREAYEPRDIFIDREGQWHARGVATNPERALQGVDVVFNALHGEYGEDGQVQRLLDRMAVPYTGSGAFSSAIAFNKQHTRNAAEKLGIKVAHGQVFDLSTAGEVEGLAHHIFRTFPHPSIVKPAAGGSSVGAAIANDFHTLERALELVFAMSPKVLVEEYIKGRETTVGVIDGFREEKFYALPPVEIVPPPSSPFFDYEAKYGGQTLERVPGNFSLDEKQALISLAKAVHEGLELSHYSRSDFIVSKRGIYFLEVNTLPGLTRESLPPQALHAVGAKLSDFLHHIISLAKRR